MALFDIGKLRKLRKLSAAMNSTGGQKKRATRLSRMVSRSVDELIRDNPEAIRIAYLKELNLDDAAIGSGVAAKRKIVERLREEAEHLLESEPELLRQLALQYVQKNFRLTNPDGYAKGYLSYTVGDGRGSPESAEDFVQRYVRLEAHFHGNKSATDSRITTGSRRSCDLEG